MISAQQANEIASRIPLNVLDDVSDQIKRSALQGKYNTTIIVDSQYTDYIKETLEMEMYRVIIGLEKLIGGEKLFISWEG